MSDNKENHALEQAKAQYSSISQMLAALSVDYDRLQELRDDKQGYVQSMDGDPKFDTPEQWEIDNPDDAKELAELEEEAGDCDSQDEARETIQEDALSVEIRSDWHSPGDNADVTDFRILLCTGGPAVQIMGELNEHKEPCRAWIEYQDWFTGWSQFFDAEQDTLLEYCRQFYFGE